jgi:hypothetical protein
MTLYGCEVDRKCNWRFYVQGERDTHEREHAEWLRRRGLSVHRPVRPALKVDPEPVEDENA